MLSLTRHAAFTRRFVASQSSRSRGASWLANLNQAAPRGQLYQLTGAQFRGFGDMRRTKSAEMSPADQTKRLDRNIYSAYSPADPTFQSKGSTPTSD